MAQSVITWNPGTGTNTLSQIINYKLASSSTWIVFNTVGPLISTATITGLLDNRIYDFQIVDNCSFGGPNISTTMKGIRISCPVNTLISDHNSVQYSFTSGAGDISKYVVELLNSTGSSILATQVIVSPGATVTGIFTSLIPSTDYKVRITGYAGITFEFSKICDANSFTTSIAPICNVPTGVTVTLS